jgi:hypothetical protein
MLVTLFTLAPSVTPVTLLTLVHPKRTMRSGLSKLSHRYGEESKTKADGDLRFCPISKAVCRLLRLAEGDQAALVWVVSSSCRLWALRDGYIKDPDAIAAAATADGREMLRMADWVSFGRLQLWRLRQKPPSR